MYLDYLQYQNFYNSTIGNSISSFLELKLKKYCFLYENQNVGGYTSHYGLRRGGDGELSPHTGLDIAAPLGSPVLSWWAGHVVDTIHDASCGIGVVVASGGYEHIYCHLQQQRMRSGQAVQAGQVIGQVGMTGRTSGPPLHWGIQFEGRWLDPALVLKAMIRSRRASGAPGP